MRAITLAVFVAVAIAVGFLVPLPELEAVRDWTAELGVVGGVGFALLYAAVTLTPAPKNVLSVAAGLAFGFGWALAAVYAGALLGAAAMSDLEGTQPVHRQSPPMRSRSTSSTSAPKRAAVLAATIPAVPPPITSRSTAEPE